MAEVFKALGLTPSFQCPCKVPAVYVQVKLWTFSIEAWSVTTLSQGICQDLRSGFNIIYECNFRTHASTNGSNTLVVIYYSISPGQATVLLNACDLGKYPYTSSICICIGCRETVCFDMSACNGTVLSQSH